MLYEIADAYAAATQDRCLLYVFRAAVYLAETYDADKEPELLKWWNRIDAKMPGAKRSFLSKND